MIHFHCGTVGRGNDRDKDILANLQTVLLGFTHWLVPLRASSVPGSAAAAATRLAVLNP